MSEIVTSTLEIQFSEQDIVKTQSVNKSISDVVSNFLIILEQMNTDLREVLGAAVIKEDTLFFKCYPTKNVTIQATMGSIVDTDEVRVSVFKELVSFGGNNSAMLHYPDAYDVSIESMGDCIQELIATKDNEWHNGIRYKKGDVYELKTVAPSFRFDVPNNAIESIDGFRKIEIYGNCLVSYKSNYKVIQYKPNFSSLKVITADDKRNKSNDQKLYAGTIFAYRLFQGKTYAVSHNVEVEKVKSPEYARVYSKIVLDEDGSHEAPVDWPNVTEIETTDGEQRNFNYLQKNGTTQKKDLDPDMSFTDQRIHLMVYIDMYGNLIFEHQQHWLLDPFDDTRILCELKDDPNATTHLNPKKPEFYLKFASPPGGAKTNSSEEYLFEMMETTWRDIFITPDKKKFKEKIIDYYGSITGIEEE